MIPSKCVALFPAGREFDFEPTLVFHEKGGLISDAQLIADNDLVYVTDKDDVATDGQGERNRLYLSPHESLTSSSRPVEWRLVSAALECNVFLREKRTRVIKWADLMTACQSSSQDEIGSDGGIKSRLSLMVQRWYRSRFGATEVGH